MFVLNIQPTDLTSQSLKLVKATFIQTHMTQTLLSSFLKEAFLSVSFFYLLLSELYKGSCSCLCEAVPLLCYCKCTGMNGVSFVNPTHTHMQTKRK